jgi:serine/threonine protein kinase
MITNSVDAILLQSYAFSMIYPHWPKVFSPRRWLNDSFFILLQWIYHLFYMKNEDIDQQMLPEKSFLQNGKYRVERRIASGGFGNTYEVTNIEFEERMALKEFFMKGISEREADSTMVSVSNTLNKGQFEAQKEKFKKEARRLRRLHNPHIVQVHDLFEENGTAYYAMDYVDGESLSNRLKRTHKPLSEQETLTVLEQVLDALETVHAQGIWHLDLKPGNIMVGTDGTAKLIDFGASKQMSAGEGYTTTTTAMCYTPGYAPTEQIDQKMELIGPWTDLYALGATLYKLLTNNEPPTVSEMQEDGAFTYPKTVSAKTRHLIRWMMTPRRQMRPQSVAEVREFLRKPFTETATDNDSEDTVYGPKKPQPAPKPKPTPTPKPAWAKWAAVAVAAFVAVGVLYFKLKPKEPDNPVGNPASIAEVVEEATKKGTNDVKKVSDRYFKSALGVCSYTGPVDGDGKPHGEGEAKFPDGREYRGTFVHGTMEGEDANFRFSNGDTFVGSFKANRFARGRYTVKEDGSYFVGTFSGGQPDQGQWYDKQGNIIE